MHVSPYVPAYLLDHVGTPTRLESVRTGVRPSSTQHRKPRIRALDAIKLPQNEHEPEKSRAENPPMSDTSGAAGTGTDRDLEPGAAPTRVARARNVLIGVGAFYVSRWLAALLRTALAALAEGTISVDGLRQALLTPFITSLSHAIAAASAGAVVVLLIDSRSPRSPGSPASPFSPASPGSSGSLGSPGSPDTSARWRWAMVPAVLWFVASLDEVTISAPGWVPLVTQLIAAALPSIVCLAAAHLADWHRSR
jgi:hypothetical protein